MSITVDELLTAWADSERAADIDRLDALLTEDFVGIGPVGFVLDKQAWLGRFDLGLGYERLELDEVVTHHHGSTALVVAHQHADGHAGPNPTPRDLRVSFTVVPDGEEGPRIAGMQYSFIGMPGPAQ
jgi:ketosteroid isomerase-like protein